MCEEWTREEEEAILYLRQDIIRERIEKGLSTDLKDLVEQAYLVSKEYGDLWSKYLLTPLKMEKEHPESDEEDHGKKTN